MEKADLEPALKALKDRLMTKNVVCLFVPTISLTTLFLSNLKISHLYYARFANDDIYTYYLQAEEIAEKLCESVAASLEGKKLGSFTRISSTVQVKSLILSNLLADIL